MKSIQGFTGTKPSCFHSDTIVPLINNNYKIKPQALELKMGTTFTYDSIKKLHTIMPRVNFYWIMGADNLCNMHNWHNWHN